MYDVVRESESARRIAATGGVTRTDRDVRYEMSSPLSDFGHEQREVPVGDTRSVLIRMLESASGLGQLNCGCREFVERTSSPYFGDPSDGLEVRPPITFSCHKPQV